MKYILPLLFIVSCSTPAQKKIREGKELATTHCSTCHQFPEPALLDKKTWVFHVLPKMGGLLGFRHFETTSYFEADYANSNLSLEQWNNIVRYYVRMSPDSLTNSKTAAPDIKTGLEQFILRIPSFRVSPPLTSYVGVFPESAEIIFGDGITKNFYRLKNLQLVDSFRLGTGLSHLVKKNGDFFGLSMGVMYPSDIREGQLARFRGSASIPVLDSLQRPVHMEFADLNNDSLTDIVVAEFGNNQGQLSWFEHRPDSSYLKHILKPLPGAVKSVIRDFDNDGRKDIMALMAQADEGMFIFYNKGSNTFHEERILRFSPSFGSNYFELADMNEDGFDDIVATNGDNGDYPAILKPYHGIRIYLNDGQYRFKEALFLPVNGVCKTIAYDFDADGDKDLASIAYFPDYDNRPNESFIYWNNSGNLKFTPRSFGGNLVGRWLVMDAGDFDSDGDADIVLGNAKMAMGNIPDTIMRNWNQGGPSVVVLENVESIR